MASGRNHFAAYRGRDGPKRVTASAYAYADGGGISNEIQLAKLIDRFGVAAVIGRPYLGAGEILRIQAAEAVLRLYGEMKQYDDWARFKLDDPDGARYLFAAMKLAHDMGLADG